MTLTKLKTTNKNWFTKDNRRFFHDLQYWVKRGASGKSYLVRSTYAWTDMFGSTKRLHYRINPVTDEGSILPLIDDEFATMESVERWLEIN